MRVLSKIFGLCKECKEKCCTGRSGEYVTGILKGEKIDSVLRVRKTKQKGCKMELDYDENGVCPHYKKGICTVYTARPVICRVYPFLPTEGGFYLINKNCSLMFEAVGNMSDKQRKKLRRELNKVFYDWVGSSAVYRRLIEIGNGYEERFYV